MLIDVPGAVSKMIVNLSSKHVSVDSLTVPLTLCIPDQGCSGEIRHNAGEGSTARTDLNNNPMPPLALKAFRLTLGLHFSGWAIVQRYMLVDPSGTIRGYFYSLT